MRAGSHSEFQKVNYTPSLGSLGVERDECITVASDKEEKTYVFISFDCSDTEI